MSFNAKTGGGGANLKVVEQQLALRLLSMSPFLLSPCPLYSPPLSLRLLGGLEDRLINTGVDREFRRQREKQIMTALHLEVQPPPRLSWPCYPCFQLVINNHDNTALFDPQQPPPRQTRVEYRIFFCTISIIISKYIWVPSCLLFTGTLRGVRRVSVEHQPTYRQTDRKVHFQK